MTGRSTTAIATAFTRGINAWIAIAQDRRREKAFFSQHGLPAGAWARIDVPADIEAALAGVRLPALLKTAPARILYGDHVVGKGEKLFDAICKEGGEGIISKKAKASYKGERSRNWLKVKCIQRQEFVIVGWSESDKRRGFRSLLLGVRDGKTLTYAGKVGTGFNAKSMEELLALMEPLAVAKAASCVTPARSGRGSTPR